MSAPHVEIREVELDTDYGPKIEYAVVVNGYEEDRYPDRSEAESLARAFEDGREAPSLRQISRRTWRDKPRDSKGRMPDGTPSVLHNGGEEGTILVAVEIVERPEPARCLHSASSAFGFEKYGAKCYDCGTEVPEQHPTVYAAFRALEEASRG